MRRRTGQRALILKPHKERAIWMVGQKRVRRRPRFWPLEVAADRVCTSECARSIPCDGRVWRPGRAETW